MKNVLVHLNEGSYNTCHIVPSVIETSEIKIHQHPALAKPKRMMCGSKQDKIRQYYNNNTNSNTQL